MSLGRFVAMCLSLGCVVSTVMADSFGDVVRFGLVAVVFAILATFERRANR